MMRRILLVDDDPNVLHALVRALRVSLKIDALRIETFTDPRLALARCAEFGFDIVISDFRMPDMSGIEFLLELKLIAPNTVRMILSASTEFETVMSAINEAEVFRYIAKPWIIAELDENIRLALEYRDKMLEDQHLADQLRVQSGTLTPQELEARRLEEDEPGIMQVNWAPDGSIIL